MSLMSDGFQYTLLFSDREHMYMFDVQYPPNTHSCLARTTANMYDQHTQPNALCMTNACFVYNKRVVIHGRHTSVITRAEHITHTHFYSKAMDTDADRSFLEDFIELYKNRPVLWDDTGKAYLSRSERHEAYKELLTLMRQYRKNSELFDVKRKINSLRGSFKRECRKQRRLEAAGIKYTPTLWWYECMAFLKPVLKANEENRKSLSKSEEVQQYKMELQSPSGSSNRTKEPSYHDEDSSQSDVPVERVPVWPAERLTESHSDQPMDEYRVIAEAWAMKLRKLPTDQQVFAEKFIADILFEGQMCTLHRNSMQLNSYIGSGGNETMEEFEHMNV